MAFGKIYTKEKNPRTTAILAVAKANGLDLETVTVDTNAPTPEYLKLNALGKVPTFEGQDGYVLYESMAIAIYRKLLLLLTFSSLPFSRLLLLSRDCLALRRPPPSLQ